MISGVRPTRVWHAYKGQQPNKCLRRVCVREKGEGEQECEDAQRISEIARGMGAKYLAREERSSPNLNCRRREKGWSREWERLFSGGERDI